eukprot:9201795-Pyramimonas_sp.AAC.1
MGPQWKRPQPPAPGPPNLPPERVELSLGSKMAGLMARRPWDYDHSHDDETGRGATDRCADQDRMRQRCAMDILLERIHLARRQNEQAGRRVPQPLTRVH